MTKIIRKTLPRDISVGVLVIIFAIVFFLAGQLFEKNQPNIEQFTSIYLGEFLVSTAVIVMILILWEEILFPVKIKPDGDGLLFRNHATKLIVQALIYLIIPAIVVFLALTYKVSPFRFYGWAAVCTILPVVGKLVSGINNYNDFLKLTTSSIAYKNNEKEGVIELKDIQQIRMIKDDSNDLQKLELNLTSGAPITIDLDEMELEAYYESIEEYITTHYKSSL